MASQQTRSAFMLTSIALISIFINAFTCFFRDNRVHSKILIVICILYSIRGTISFDASSIDESIVLPKFGDRISPRTRPFLEVEKLKTIKSSSSIGADNNNFNNNNNDNVSINNDNNDMVPLNAAEEDYGDFTLNGGKQNSDSSVNESAAQSGDHSLNINNSSLLNGTNSVENEIAYNMKNNGSIKLTKQNHRKSTVSHQYINAYANNAHSVEVDKIKSGVAAASDTIVVLRQQQQQKELNQQPIDDQFKDPSIEGNSTSAQAHRLEMSTEFFVVPSTSPSTIASHHFPGGIILSNRPKNQASIVPPLSHNRNSHNVTQPTIISANHHPHHQTLGLRKEPWVVPVLVLTSLVMLMMAAFEIFVLCKAWQTSPSRRHLFLGQMLLLGLFLCACLAAILTVSPSVFSCGFVRFGSGVAFALVFSSLLVKCVFLISLNSGVYLPAPYQGLLLLFAVLIQVAIGGQWLITTPAEVDEVAVPMRNGPLSLTHHSLLLTAQDITMTTTIPLCRTQFVDLLYSHVYVIFLILFVALLAIKSRRIRENYREATYIGLAIGGSIPIWLGWTLCGLAVADRHKDACLAFGLIATSATVFLVMFMPKGRQLAAMGKEGLYIEDRDEQLSSLSRTGSGYSPSFFHFKPIKYGVMGNALASNTNTVNNTTTKHQPVASIGNECALHAYSYYFILPQNVQYMMAPSQRFVHHKQHKQHTIHPYQPHLAQYYMNHGPGLFIRQTDETNLYTTLEPTMSSNPNVYFQRGGNVHPGMMY